MCENINAEAFTDQLTLAGYSIQAAIRHWNNAANWKWLGTTSSTYTMTVGTDTYRLPGLCKNVHSIRVQGSTPRALEYIGRRPLNKIIPKQDQQLLPYFYDLFTNESHTGDLRLFPIPSLAEQFVVDYYRQMAVPMTASATFASGTFSASTNLLTFPGGTTTNGMTVGSSINATGVDGGPGVLSGTIDIIASPTSIYVTGTVPNHNMGDLAGSVSGGDSTFLDIPADYEDGILAWASHHYLAKRQGGGPKLQYWASYAQEQLDKALRNNMTDTPDHEICFLPSYMSDSAFLGPNDIRWADIPW